jgi:hypothetical protein
MAVARRHERLGHLEPNAAAQAAAGEWKLDHGRRLPTIAIA